MHRVNGVGIGEIPMSVSCRYYVGIASVRDWWLVEIVNLKRLAKFQRRLPDATYQLIPKPVNSDEVARLSVIAKRSPADSALQAMHERHRMPVRRTFGAPIISGTPLA